MTYTVLLMFGLMGYCVNLCYRSIRLDSFYLYILM